MRCCKQEARESAIAWRTVEVMDENKGLLVVQDEAALETRVGATPKVASST